MWTCIDCFSVHVPLSDTTMQWKTNGCLFFLFFFFWSPRYCEQLIPVSGHSCQCEKTRSILACTYLHSSGLYSRQRLVQFSSVQPLGPSSRLGDMMNDSVEILFRPFLREAIVTSSGMDRDVHSLTLSIQYFRCRPQRRPSTLQGALKDGF